MSDFNQVDMAQARGTYRIFTQLVISGAVGVAVLLILMAFFLL